MLRDRTSPEAQEVAKVHVVVVGCGRVGSGLAAGLEVAGHTVAIIDRKASAFRRLPESYTGPRLVGVGFDRELLIEAGIEKAGGLASVTNGDNSNIVIARVAKEAFGIERVVARIYDPRRAAIYERLGISTIATVGWTTKMVLRRLLPDDNAADWTDPSARVQLVERTLPTGWAGRKLADLDVGGLSRVVAVSRLGAALVPSTDTVGQDGDVVWLSVSADRIKEVEALLGATRGGH